MHSKRRSATKANSSLLQIANRRSQPSQNSINNLAERKSSQRLQQEEFGSWSCSVCTYLNAKEAFKCEICNTRKGTSTRKPRINNHVVEQQQLIEKSIILQSCIPSGPLLTSCELGLLTNGASSSRAFPNDYSSNSNESAVSDSPVSNSDRLSSTTATTNSSLTTATRSHGKRSLVASSRNSRAASTLSSSLQPTQSRDSRQTINRLSFQPSSSPAASKHSKPSIEDPLSRLEVDTSSHTPPAQSASPSPLAARQSSSQSAAPPTSSNDPSLPPQSRPVVVIYSGEKVRFYELEAQLEDAVESRAASQVQRGLSRCNLIQSDGEESAGPVDQLQSSQSMEKADQKIEDEEEEQEEEGMEKLEDHGSLNTCTPPPVLGEPMDLESSPRKADTESSDEPPRPVQDEEEVDEDEEEESALCLVEDYGLSIDESFTVAPSLPTEF